jgi:hypothetical protein
MESHVGGLIGIRSQSVLELHAFFYDIYPFHHRCLLALRTLELFDGGISLRTFVRTEDTNAKEGSEEKEVLSPSLQPHLNHLFLSA